MITEGLEEEQRKLQKELQELEKEKEELECRFQSHISSGNCRRNLASGLKPTDPPRVSTLAKSRRPSSLPIGPHFAISSNSSNSSSNSSPAVTTTCSTSLSDGTRDSLVPIQTPSTGLFDNLCGLTPLLETPSAGGFMPSVSSCGGQNRGQFSVSDSMIASPDGPSTRKLVSL